MHHIRRIWGLISRADGWHHGTAWEIWGLVVMDCVLLCHLQHGLNERTVVIPGKSAMEIQSVFCEVLVADTVRHQCLICDQKSPDKGFIFPPLLERLLQRFPPFETAFLELLVLCTCAAASSAAVCALPFWAGTFPNSKANGSILLMFFVPPIEYTAILKKEKPLISKWNVLKRGWRHSGYQRQWEIWWV